MPRSLILSLKRWKKENVGQNNHAKTTTMYFKRLQTHLKHIKISQKSA